MHTTIMRVITLLILVSSLTTFAQQQATSSTTTATTLTNSTGNTLFGILNPSRLAVNHSVSFGMSSSSGVSGLQSQSLYTTMLSYQFSAPLTLHVDLGFPIFSSHSMSQNLSAQNFKSADYFKSMPFDASLTWKPAENFLMKITVARNTTDPFSNYSPFMNHLFLDNPLR